MGAILTRAPTAAAVTLVWLHQFTFCSVHGGLLGRVQMAPPPSSFAEPPPLLLNVRSRQLTWLAVFLFDRLPSVKPLPPRIWPPILLAQSSWAACKVPCLIWASPVHTLLALHSGDLSCSVELDELGHSRAHLVDCTVDLGFVHFAIVLE